LVIGNNCMAILYVLIGVQGAGKSTWARANAERLDAVVVASDDIRNELDAAGVDPTNEGDRVFAIFDGRVARLLDAGRNVIADATHARERWRANILAIARQRGGQRVAVWLDLPLAVCRARNAHKPGGPLWGNRIVAEEVLQDMWRTFEPPVADEFDEIRTLRE
jgi:predicted kinase